MTARGTLLAKMGFADRDRKDPMHDAACGYIASRRKEVYRHLTGLRPFATKAHQEVLISKGDGQYRTTVGFLDLVLTSETWERYWESSYYLGEDVTEIAACYRLVSADTAGSLRVWSETRAAESRVTVGIEVKWTEESVSDAIRQVSVYRDHFRSHVGAVVWAIAAPWELNVEQKAALDSQRIKYIRLSRENVAAWAQKNRATAAPAEMVL